MSAALWMAIAWHVVSRGHSDAPGVFGLSDETARPPRVEPPVRCSAALAGDPELAVDLGRVDFRVTMRGPQFGRNVVLDHGRQ